MMAFEPMNEETYETAATFITYAKLFPYIMDDFVTRDDSKEMMGKSNLPVNINAGQAVNTTGSPAAQAGFTVSPGSGLAQPIYDGSFPSPGTKVLEQKIKAKKEAGGATVSGLTKGLEKATGA